MIKTVKVEPVSTFFYTFAREARKKESHRFDNINLGDNIMTAITLNSRDYNMAKSYADERNIKVDELFVLMIHSLAGQKKKFAMKPIESLSPELRQVIGFAKSPNMEDGDLNGEEAKDSIYKEKYGLR